MMNQNAEGAGVEKRLRTMRILWAVFLVTVGLLALVPYLALGDREEGDAVFAADFPAVYVFLAAGLALVAASFVAKRSFFAKAERERRVEPVQTGLIIALALCEMAAQLGLAALFLLADSDAYYLFALAAVGQLLHFPRREPLLAATRQRAF